MLDEDDGTAPTWFEGNGQDDVYGLRRPVMPMPEFSGIMRLWPQWYSQTEPWLMTNHQPIAEEADVAEAVSQTEEGGNVLDTLSQQQLQRRRGYVTIDIRSMHQACSGLVFAFECVDNADADTDVALHPFLECTLMLNGHHAYQDTAERMRTWQWQHCGLPIPPRQKWYLMPFSSTMFADKPHMTTNFGRIDHIVVRFRLNPDAMNYRWRCEIGGPTFTLYRIRQGRFDFWE